MNKQSAVDLRDAIQIQNQLIKYRDDTYKSVMNTFNTQCQEVLKDDLGPQFIKACGRDLAGEIIRNFFDMSDYYITVDQLAERILEFSYENEYDPIGNDIQIRKNVLNYDDISSERLERIVEFMDASQAVLFEKEKVDGKNRYKDRNKIEQKKNEYYNQKKNDDGTVDDEYTGDKGEYITDKNGNRRRREQVDHVQALNTARYNERYIKEKGINALKEMYNSESNFAMMVDVANQAKGDVKVLDKNGNDITHRATPEQYADAIIERWENSKAKDKLIEKGYLDESGNVPKHIKQKLIENIRHSQNEESKVILKNTNYVQVGKDAGKEAVKSIGKILAGQILYYGVPPLVYETREILRNKPASLDNAIKKLRAAGKRIVDYLISKLKPLFMNVAFNTFKNFIKIFIDILINLVKATIKKILKAAKKLVLATADAVRIVIQKGSTATQKADAVCNLFGVTITSIAVDVLFDAISTGLHIPDCLMAPLQILTTVVCTNLTMLILQKADLFDVRHGFKLQQIQNIFDESYKEYNKTMAAAENLALSEIDEIINNAKANCRQIYYDIIEFNPYEFEVRSHLESIKKTFGMDDVDFNDKWLKFIGVDSEAVMA